MMSEGCRKRIMSRTVFDLKAAVALDDEGRDLQEVDLGVREREGEKERAEFGIVGIKATSFFSPSLGSRLEVGLDQQLKRGEQLDDMLSSKIR